MNIAYCLNSIKVLGGTERVTIQKANALSAIEGNRVFVLVTDNNRGTLASSLNEAVTVIDLNINYYDDDWQPGWRAKISQLRKKRKHKVALRNALDNINPDVVIAVGQSEKFFTKRGFLKKSQAVYIRELHYATDYRTLLAKSTKEKIIGKIQNILDFRILCRYYDAVVCLTPQDLAKNWKGVSNVYFIPNPLTVDFPPNSQTCTQKKIISLGRLSYQKNYSSLIRAFTNIAPTHPEWMLEIYGSGEENSKLGNLIRELNMEKQIKLMGSTTNVASKLENASIFALSSRAEGFALVLLEAMSHGLPVVSYDCPFGPSYIIDSGRNGILVPLNDEVMLASSLNYLIQSRKIRDKMGLEARKRAIEFLPEKIAEQWMSLFNNLIHNRR